MGGRDDHLQDLIQSLGAKLEKARDEIVGEVKSIDNRLRAKEIDDATNYANHDGEIRGLQARAGGLHRKINSVCEDSENRDGVIDTKLEDHKGEHWKFLLASTGLIGTVLVAAKFLAG